LRWRCPLAIDKCHDAAPPLRTLGKNHEAARHLAEPDIPAT
jgi:peptide/nickel transport system ATP-binding protein